MVVLGQVVEDVVMVQAAGEKGFEHLPVPRWTPELRRRAAALRFEARQIRERSATLRAKSEWLRLRSEDLVALVGVVGADDAHHGAARTHQVDWSASGPETPSGGIVGFRLAGAVAGEPVVADWGPDGPVASDALMTQAGLVVRLGETFVSSDGRELAASLHRGATAALLTFIRACDRVESVAVHLATAEASRGSGSAVPID